jgi:hypothetical protein
MHVYIHTCAQTHMHTMRLLQASSFHKHVHMHTCTHIHTCTHTHMFSWKAWACCSVLHMHTCTHIHTCTYTHMHRICSIGKRGLVVQFYICIHAHIYIHVHIRTCTEFVLSESVGLLISITYAYMRTFTYMYTYAHAQNLFSRKAWACWSVLQSSTTLR